MKFIKQISLLALLSFGASAIAPVVQVQALPSAGMLSKLTLDSWSSWVKDFKFEIKPSNLTKLIEANPKTAFAIGILGTIGAIKLYDYYWEYLADVRKKMVTNIDDALLHQNIATNETITKQYLLEPNYCCNVLEFLYFLKWNVSRAELVGGKKLKQAIGKFYEARQNWTGQSKQTVKKMAEDIKDYLQYQKPSALNPILV